MTNRIMELADAMAKAHLVIYKDDIQKEQDGIEKARTDLQAEVERVSEDADRYRWLRDMDMLGSPSVDLAVAFQKYTGGMLDGYIDAAMKDPS